MRQLSQSQAIQLQGYDPYEHDIGWFGSSIVKSIGKAAKKVGKGLSTVTKVAAKPFTLQAELLSKGLKKIPVVGGIAGSVLDATTSLQNLPLRITQQILEGGNINKVALGNLKQALSDVRTVGPWVQTVISFVPGVGTGISAAIGAGLALAEGKSISEAMIAAAKGALPGGAAAQMAFGVAQGVLERKPVDQIAIGALPISDQQKRLLTQGMQAAKDIASGKNVSKSIIDNAVKSLPPQYAKAVQVGMAIGHAKSLQEALKTGAKGAVAIGGQAALKHVGEKVKLSSILGASKTGIQKAIGAAPALKMGSPVLKKALLGAVKGIRSGSPEHLGFATAVKVLKQTSGNKGALGAARRALPTESARRAFDSAIGTVSHTVSRYPGALSQRAGSSFVPVMSKVKGVISPYAPNLSNAITSLGRNPTLMMEHPLVLANKFGTTQQTVLQAMRHVGGKRLLPWRSLSPRASSFVKRFAPMGNTGWLSHGTNDTAGLDESGTKYIVEKGDSPFKIALKLTGNGNRWVELKALNTDKKPSITQNVWVGEVLNLPASWQKPIVKPQSPGPAASSQPLPERPTATTVSTPQISVAPGILQAKTILVAWSKTDGVNQAGVPDYGARAEDLSTSFGPRDKIELMSFQSWSTKTGHAPLVVDGILGPKSLAALQSWAERRAAQATTVASPTVTTLPEIVIEASAPKSAPVVVSSPGQPPVVVSAPSPVSNPAPVLPPVATPAQPATPATVAATAPQTGSKLGPALAGAAVGGTLFGLPGAILGGIAGAAMS